MSVSCLRLCFVSIFLMDKDDEGYDEEMPECDEEEDHVSVFMWLFAPMCAQFCVCVRVDVCEQCVLFYADRVSL